MSSWRVRSRDTCLAVFETGLSGWSFLSRAGTERDLRQSIDDLNHRLRYALGEYNEPPRPLAVPE
jgi:hypothetical protein